MFAKNYQIWLMRFKDKSKNVCWSPFCTTPYFYSLDAATRLQLSGDASKVRTFNRSEVNRFANLRVFLTFENFVIFFIG